MPSKARHENYFMIDNSNSDGIPEELMRAVGLPPSMGRGKHEYATYTCSHCQTQIVVEPFRTRDRSYCSKCDHYICDLCGAQMAITGQCHSIKRIFDELLEAAARSSAS